MRNHKLKHKDAKPLRGHKEHKEDRIYNSFFVLFVFLCDLCV